jgi:hypothetical protein
MQQCSVHLLPSTTKPPNPRRLQHTGDRGTLRLIIDGKGHTQFSEIDIVYGTVYTTTSDVSKRKSHPQEDQFTVCTYVRTPTYMPCIWSAGRAVGRSA